MATKFDDMLGTSATTKEKKKSSKTAVPTIILPEEPKELRVDFQEFLKQKKIEKDSKNLKQTSEVSILKHCQDILDIDGFKGDYNSSYSVTDGKETIKFITADSFSVPQDEAVISAIKELLGDNADKVIEEKRTVLLKQEVFTNEELKAKLVKRIGDEFALFFETIVEYQVKDGFAEKQFDLVGKDPEKLKTLRGFVVQKKASLK